VVNQGVEWKAPFWKMNRSRKERARIVLQGKSRLIARDVVLKGNFDLIVEDGTEVELFMKDGEVKRVVKPTLLRRE
jgi:hypothetical protein